MAILGITVVKLTSAPVIDGDILRFTEIANSPGTPYRDFAVEYPPLEVFAIKLLSGSDAAGTGVRVAVLAFACDIASWWLIRAWWGDRSGQRFLMLGTPLLLFAYLRLDPFPVLLALVGAVLARAHRDRAAGAVLGVAVLAKLWPLALFPVLLRLRGFLVASAVVAAGGIAWIASVGTAGPEQVLTFRGATGWGVESTVGVFLWIGGEAVGFESGAPRVGSIPPWSRLGLSAFTAVVLVAIWRRARERRGDPAGGASMAAVAAVISLSPLYSLQYASWLVPWAAIESRKRDGAPFVLVALITTLTGVLFSSYGGLPWGLTQVLLLIRNGSTIALPVWWFLRGREELENPQPSEAVDTSVGR